jgi:hypothetical protein
MEIKPDVENELRSRPEIGGTTVKVNDRAYELAHRLMDENVLVPHTSEPWSDSRGRSSSPTAEPPLAAPLAGVSRPAGPQSS